ncbi:MAG: DUF5777 family beta-barrel protein [Bacteroidota bacterium]
MIRKTIFTLFLCACISYGYGQDGNYVYQTFKDTRVINSHSTEILPKRKLDMRIGHRFGDFAGDVGGWNNFYGLENASDVLIGLEYGVTDNFMVGINRTKGSGPLRQLVNGFFKYRLLRQSTSGGAPVSLAVAGIATASTAQAASTENLLNTFSEFAHRMSYTGEVIISRKFGDAFSLQVHGGIQHRNLVDFNDENTMPFVGGAAKYQFSRMFGLIVDFTAPISDLRTSENGYYPALGIGFEFDTGGGHVFQVNLTNATALSENDFIPNTRTNWGDGQYRLGFTISRWFNL